MKKFLALACALAMLCLMVVVAAPTAASPHAAYAAEVLRLVNAERASAGLPALSGANAGLNAAAQRRAVEVTTHLSHTRPNGRAWSTVLDEFPVGPRIRIGENIAAGHLNPSVVVQAWMQSPSHRANVMGNFTHMGVGIQVGSSGRMYWVQLFIHDGSTPGQTTTTTTTTRPPTTTTRPPTTTTTTTTTTRPPTTTTRPPTTTTTTTTTRPPTTTTPPPTTTQPGGGGGNGGNGGGWFWSLPSFFQQMFGFFILSLGWMFGTAN